jgi:hypothetical protein
MEQSAPIDAKRRVGLVVRSQFDSCPQSAADAKGASMDEKDGVRVDRRGFLRVLATTGLTAATAAVPLEYVALADAETSDADRKFRYRVIQEVKALPVQPLPGFREPLMLVKRAERDARRGRMAGALGGAPRGTDRRAFLRRSGLATGGALAAIGTLPLDTVRKAAAQPRRSLTRYRSCKYRTSSRRRPRSVASTCPISLPRR